MKKIIIFSAFALMSFFVSCNKNDVSAPQQACKVTFSTALEDYSQSTRAMGDGTLAKELDYVLYDYESGALIESGHTQLDETGNTTVSLTLYAGKPYTVAFWADAFSDNTPYAFDAEKKTLTIDYNGLAANNESLDAFYKSETVIVEDELTWNVTLTRPFAQLNIGAVDAKQFVTSSSLTVTGLGNTLDLISGSVGGDPAEVTFAKAAAPDGSFAVNGEAYEYILMNYLLVGIDKKSLDISYVGYDADGKEITSKSMNMIPFRRNWKTNIYGQSMTVNEDFAVNVNPGFGGDTLYPTEPPADSDGSLSDFEVTDGGTWE